MIFYRVVKYLTDLPNQLNLKTDASDLGAKNSNEWVKLFCERSVYKSSKLGVFIVSQNDLDTILHNQTCVNLACEFMMEEFSLAGHEPHIVHYVVLSNSLFRPYAPTGQWAVGYTSRSLELRFFRLNMSPFFIWFWFV